jgi:hypothetical protein
MLTHNNTKKPSSSSYSKPSNPKIYDEKDNIYHVENIAPTPTDATDMQEPPYFYIPEFNKDLTYLYVTNYLNIGNIYYLTYTKDTNTYEINFEPLTLSFGGRNNPLVTRYLKKIVYDITTLLQLKNIDGTNLDQNKFFDLNEFIKNSKNYFVTINMNDKTFVFKVNGVEKPKYKIESDSNTLNNFLIKTCTYSKRCKFIPNFNSDFKFHTWICTISYKKATNIFTIDFTKGINNYNNKDHYEDKDEFLNSTIPFFKQLVDTLNTNNVYNINHIFIAFNHIIDGKNKTIFTKNSVITIDIDKQTIKLVLNNTYTRGENKINCDLNGMIEFMKQFCTEYFCRVFSSASTMPAVTNPVPVNTNSVPAVPVNTNPVPVVNQAPVETAVVETANPLLENKSDINTTANTTNNVENSVLNGGKTRHRKKKYCSIKKLAKTIPENKSAYF